MTRSLAFWIEKTRKQEEKAKKRARKQSNLTEEEKLEEYEEITKADLHINYWSLNSGQKSYLDIGVKITEVTNFKSINIYLPISINDIDVSWNLGEKICSHEDLMSAIFNEEYQRKGNNLAKSFSDFTMPSEKKPLRIFRDIPYTNKNINSANNAYLTPELHNYPGTTLTIPVNSLSFVKDRHNYFRIRFQINNNNPINYNKTYSHSYITGQLDSLEFIDFRINEVRDLPLNVKKQTSLYKGLNKVHFFLIMESDASYEMSNSGYSRCRIIEKNIWDKYFDDGIEIDDNMLIYHWKKSSEGDSYIDNFSVFSKFTRRSITWERVAPFILSIIFLSALSSLLITWGYDKLKTETTMKEEDSALECTTKD